MPSNSQIEQMQRMTEDYIRSQYGRGQDFWNKGNFFADRAADMNQKRQQMIDPIYNEILRPGMADYLGMLQDPLEYQSLADTEGLPPEAIAALKANAIDTTGHQFGIARSRLKEQMGKRGMVGGASGASGIYGRMLMPLFSAEAQTRQGALRDVILQNIQQQIANQANQNEFNLTNRLQDLGGYSNLIQGANQGIATIGSTYSPDPYLTAATNMYGLNVDTGRNILGGIGERGQHMKQSKWEQYGMPIIGAGIGAGMNFLTGGLAGGKPDFSGNYTFGKGLP